MYTFDNSFQLSFLFRDGLITIETGEDGLPSVYPIERRKDATQEKEDTVSFCITLDQKIIMVKISPIQKEIQIVLPIVLFYAFVTFRSILNDTILLSPC